LLSKISSEVVWREWGSPVKAAVGLGLAFKHYPASIRASSAVPPCLRHSLTRLMMEP
jgi:hypothetical protein